MLFASVSQGGLPRTFVTCRNLLLSVMVKVPDGQFPHPPKSPQELLTRHPVNYGIRFSSPVTSLTARRVCQADPLAGYKAIVPSRFSINSILSPPSSFQ
jgi:hypothetical protein